MSSADGRADGRTAAPPRVSVVVCTYDRNDLLPELFAALAAQTLPPERFEVVVVDNASPRSVAEQVDAARSRHPALRLRLVFESELGLVPARNRGFRESTAEWIAFTDDDCRPSAEWLASRLAAASESETAPAVIAGPTHPRFVGESPAGFRPEWVTIDAGPPRRRVSHAWRELTISGSNLMIRRQALRAVGGFAQDRGCEGMRGAMLGLGEDTRLVMRILEKPELGPVVWDPAAPVLDLVLPEQQTLRYRAVRAFANEQLIVSLSRWEPARPSAASRRRAPWRLAAGAVGALARSVDATLRLIVGTREARFTGACDLARLAGRLLARAGIRPSLRQRPASRG